MIEYHFLITDVAIRVFMAQISCECNKWYNDDTMKTRHG